MHNYILTSLLLCSLFVNAQFNSYTSFIQQDTSIHWASESDKFIDLSPKVADYSVKQFYLNGLRNGTLRSYIFNSDKRSLSPVNKKHGDLSAHSWLKGYRYQRSTFEGGMTGYYFTPEKPDGTDFRIYGLSRDSCCGCDRTDATIIKQILFYRKNKFHIYNVFLSPLCARLIKDNIGAWYPLANVAFNTKPIIPRIILSKDFVRLGSQKIVYDISGKTRLLGDSILTTHADPIMKQLFDDIAVGRIKVNDAQQNKPVAPAKFLTWRMPADTMIVIDDEGKEIYKVITQERSTENFPRLRIEQEFYFDFKNEKLYSVIKTIELMQEIRSGSDIPLGYYPAFIIKY